MEHFQQRVKRRTQEHFSRTCQKEEPPPGPRQTQAVLGVTGGDDKYNTRRGYPYHIWLHISVLYQISMTYSREAWKPVQQQQKSSLPSLLKTLHPEKHQCRFRFLASFGTL